MGGCATKFKVLESKEAPLPVEAAAPAAPATTEKAETICLQESSTGDETMKEKTLVDVIDAGAVEAPKEEATKDSDEAKPETEAVPKEVEAEVKEEKKEVVETVATPEVAEVKEEKKEVVETAATPEAPKATETDVIPEAPKAAAEEAKEK